MCFGSFPEKKNVVLRQWTLMWEDMATDEGSYNVLSKLGQFCTWRGVVLIIRLGDPAQTGMVPGKSVFMVTSLMNNPHIKTLLCLPSCCYYFSCYLVAGPFGFWSSLLQPLSPTRIPRAPPIFTGTSWKWEPCATNAPRVWKRGKDSCSCYQEVGRR